MCGGGGGGYMITNTNAMLRSTWCIFCHSCIQVPTGFSIAATREQVYNLLWCMACSGFQVWG